jgi:hypothetical protein
LPSSELTEWIAYYRLEPWGQERDNWHSAQVAAIIANVNRKKGTPALSVDEFMYRDRQTTRDQKTKGFLAGMRTLGKRG